VRRQIELGRVAARGAVGIAAVDAVGCSARHVWCVGVNSSPAAGRCVGC
jgi:hypothetical protein